MATTQDFVEYVHEQSGLGNELTYKKMFGEYALYLDGKVVALACDNSLFVRPTQATQELAASLASRPPYPGAKPYIVLDELLDDTDTLRKVLMETASYLPAPKPKAPKKNRGRR